MFGFMKKNQPKPAEVRAPVKEDRVVSLDGPGEASPTPAASGDDAVNETLARKRRRAPSPNKTRLMGFDTSDGRVVDLFDEDKASTDTGRTQFPVAMVMVVKGPGLGESFIIKGGMSQIGRGEDQAIRLDFGDNAISRDNHAAIAYDNKDHTFLLGHGGKSNIVRLNGKPVVSSNNLKTGDEVEIGETTLRFVAICSKKFNWTEAEIDEGSDDDDVEIA